MIKKLKELYQDSLFQNSIYLMLTTAITALLGFVFWVICSKFYTPDQIGIATSLISAMSLISYMSLLGFNNTFIRILPTSTNRSVVINTGLLLSLIASVFVSILYIVSIDTIAPKLRPELNSVFHDIGFVFLVTLATTNLLTDSIFIAFRGAKYNLLINGFIQGIIKLILPVLLVYIGSYGIFLASGAAASIAMVASITFLVLKFEYKPRIFISIQTIKNLFNYSFVNYIANIFNIAPTLILPLIVLNHLGAANAGYYYLAFTIANLLYAVVYAVSSSLFAEGSYAEESLKDLVTKATKIVAIIIVPSTIILVFFGPTILGVFGKSYSDSARDIVRIFAISSPAVAAYTLGNIILRIFHKVNAIITVNFIYMISISFFAYMWVDYGLYAVGYAWMAGNIIASLYAFKSIYDSRHQLV